MRTRFLLPSLLAIAAATGCTLDEASLDTDEQALSTGGGGLPTSYVDFSVSANPSSLSTIAGWDAGFDLVTVGAASGGCESVSYAASSLPAGIQVSYPGGNTFTLCAGKTIKTGVKVVTTWATEPATYSLTFVASGGGHTHSVPVTVTVQPQRFAPVTWPTGVNLDGGKSADIMVTVDGTLTSDNPLWASSYQLAVYGLPAGVTASFYPSSAVTYAARATDEASYLATLSTLTFTAAAGVSVPPTNVLVVATTGTRTATTTIQIGPNSQLIPDSVDDLVLTGSALTLGGWGSSFACDGSHGEWNWLDLDGTATASTGNLAIPASATSATLSYWLWGSTSSLSYARVVLFDHTTGAVVTLATYDALQPPACTSWFSPYTYQRKVIDLSAYRGHQIVLQWRIDTPSSAPAGEFSLDSVSLSVAY